MSELLAYHFTADTLRDGRPVPPVGVMLFHTGPLVMCESGLHASVEPFDAFQYAPGPMLHRVRLSGEIIEEDDKCVASERTIIATVDATEAIREFARWCALQVIASWEPPPVVLDYLTTGNEALRETARAAARAAAGAAANAAANAAARAAARAAAGAAAWDAAWDAANAAANAAAGAAAQAAAQAAAWDAAWDAANAAAWAATQAAQRQRFDEMIASQFAEETKKEDHDA